MKAKQIILIVLLLILILAGIGIQIFLTRGLTTVLNDTVFPELKTQYGLDAGIENATVKLWKGQAVITGLTVLNPDNYEKPVLLAANYCAVQIQWKSLIKRDPIVVKLVQINGAELTIERNKEHDINIKDLGDVIRNPPQSQTPAPEKKPEPQETSPAPVPAEETKPVSVQFRRIEIDGKLLYTDRVIDREYPMVFELAGNNLFTVPEEGQPSTLLTLRGSRANDPTAFKTDLSVFMEPLTDLENPTFNATGSVKNIDPKLIEKLLHKNDMKSSSFSVHPSVACKKGNLDGSSVDVTLNDFEYQKTKLGDTTLHIPVGGTLQNRTYDLTAALQSLLSNNAESLIKAFMKKDKYQKDNKADKPKKEEEATTSDLLIDKLGDSVKEVDENQELKKSLQELGNSLFGD